LFEAVSRRAGFDGRRLYLWNTGNTVSNAAIIGLFPTHRVVVFSDLLLSQLDLRQLASVYAHEIGHAKKHHVLIFAAWALATLFGADLVATRVASDDPAWTSAILLASMAVWVLLFGWLSRRFELEADIFSLRLIGEAGPLMQALEQVSGPHGHRRTSWRHFSTERRIAFLESVLSDPTVAVRLERRLRTAARAGFALAALVFLLQGADLLRQWPRDRVFVDLRRGDYASAVERMASGAVSDDSGSLAPLVRRAGSLAQGDLGEIERRARAALAAGEVEAASEWLDLGALRGDPSMALVREVLAQAPSTPRDEREGLLGALPESWRDVLAPYLRPVRPDASGAR
jgi:predicted Zn-dependent protease